MGDFTHGLHMGKPKQYTALAANDNRARKTIFSPFF